MALPADPSLIHAVILCSSLAILWQVSTVIIVIIRRRLIQIMDDGIQQDCNFHYSGHYNILGQHCRDHSFLLLLPRVICSNVIILQNDGKPRVEKKYYAVLAIILQAVGIFIGDISTLFVS